MGVSDADLVGYRAAVVLVAVARRGRVRELSGAWISREDAHREWCRRWPEADRPRQRRRLGVGHGARTDSVGIRARLTLIDRLRDLERAGVIQRGPEQVRVLRWNDLLALARGDRAVWW